MGKSTPVIDVTDIVIIGILLVGGAFFLYRRSFAINSSKFKSGSYGGGDGGAGGAGKNNLEEKGFINSLKEKDIIVFFGSQTGTAEDYAARLAKEASRYGLKAMTADLEDYDMSQLKNFPPDKLAAFVLATYGEGEPTDNAVAFHEWLTEEVQQVQDSPPDELPLKNLHFVAFGLGNKTYEYFNATIRNVDKWCKTLGGTRIGARGEGDDDGNLEEHYIIWKDNMWLEACQFMKIDPSTAANVGALTRSYSLVEHQKGQIASGDVYTGELGLLKPKSNALPTYDAKNPYYATVSLTRELFSGDAINPPNNRNCIHLEIDISGTRVSYQAGDHVAIWPVNPQDMVEKVAGALGLLEHDDSFGLKIDKMFSLVTIDPTARKKNPFPCPTTYRTALTHYVDLSTPLKQHVLQSFLQYATSEDSKAFIQKVVTDKEFYHSEIVEKHTTISDLLVDHPCIRLPVDVFFESLNRIQARYYSISSSPKTHPTSIHVTATVLRYNTSHGKLLRGLCSGFLYDTHIQLQKNPQCQIKLPIYIRRSNFKLPRRNDTPIVMIGPGTGVAPFRGFAQERTTIASKLKDKTSPSVASPLGESILFFGCRKSTEDFLYSEEWPVYIESGGLSKLVTAFSREQKEKIYVQHRLESEKEWIWELVSKKGSYLYVCGDAKNMARDVHKWFVDLAVSLGGLQEEKAVKWVKDLKAKGRYLEDVWS